MSSFIFSGGVEVLGFISPTDTSDEYAVIDPLYGIDGLRNVSSISELNAITTLRRRPGMVVGVNNGSQYYKLNPAPWNGTLTDWSLFTPGIFTGGTVSGETNFTSGVTATTFSAGTYLNLPIDNTVTGGTYNPSNGSVTFTNNTGGTFTVTGFITGFTDIQVTGYTYSANTFTIYDSSGNTFSATINSMTGLTVNGVISATTISASTYQNLPITTLTVNSTPIQSGFTGGILFQSSANTVSQSSNLFWDTSLNRLGIGTTSPSFTVDIQGSTRSVGTLQTGTANSANGTLRVERNSGNTGITIQGSNGNLIGAGFVPVYEPYNYADASHNFNIGHASLGNYNWYAGSNNAITLNTFLMRLTRGGNLLVGTSTDAGFRLDVNGTARVQGEANVSFLSLAGNTAVNSSGSIMILGASGAWTGVRVPRYFEISGSINASSGFTRGTFINQTLVATANNDTLYALDIAPSFTTGSFTGVTSVPLRIRNSSGTGNAFYIDGIGNAVIAGSLNTNTVYGTGNINLSSGSGNLLLQTNFTVNTGLVMFNSTRNIVIQNGGTFVDAGFTLDVNGTGRFQNQLTLSPPTNTTALSVSGYNVTGSSSQTGVDINGTWNTSGTPIGIKLNVNDVASNSNSLLMALQTSGVTRFSVTKAGVVSCGSITSNGNIVGFSINTVNGQIGTTSIGLKIPQTILDIRSDLTSTATLTSGNVRGIYNFANFTPTTGTAVWNAYEYNGIINQTGGSNGITRGFYSNPTLTSSADWRSIEWSNNTGFGLYGAGTANNYLGGRLGIGTTSLTNTILNIGGNISGSISSSAIRLISTVQSDVVQAEGVLSQISIANNFTLNTLNHFYILQGVIGTGSILNNQNGFFVGPNITGATNNFGFRGLMPSGVGRWNLYMDGTANNYLSGKLLLNTTTDAGYQLDVVGSSRVSASSTIWVFDVISSVSRVATQNSNLFSITMGGVSTGQTAQNPLLVQFDSVQSGLGGYTVLRVNSTQITLGSGDKLLQTWELNGVQRSVVNSLGNFGIGTTNPQALLNVANTGTTGTTALFSGAGQNVVTIVGSGSTQPIFTIQGSSGELFSVTDSLTGSLFSVNDISGLPILEVFSNNTTLMGSYLAPSLNTTAYVIATIGTTNVYSIPTSAYTGAFFDYTVSDGTNLRAGNIMSIWSGTSVNFTETSTTDFGNTSGLTFNMIVSSGNVILRTSGTTGNWTVKTIVRSI